MSLKIGIGLPRLPGWWSLSPDFTTETIDRMKVKSYPQMNDLKTFSKIMMASLKELFDLLVARLYK